MSTSPTPTVVLGVSGCIAAYKSCELVRVLTKAGCTVKVIMTDNATRFVGPATFRALSGQPVATSLWDEPAERVHHVSLAQEADVFVIAPATANVCAKIATGRADDLLTTTALATEAPVVIAPAMNVHMWRAEPTVDNITTLRARGVIVIDPETGDLACGDVGEGRLADVGTIAHTVLAELHRSRDLEDVEVLVTAGPTHEAIDPVRFISNPSSGTTGFALAEEAARRGARVTLVTGPVKLPDPFGVHVVRVTSAVEMATAVDAHYQAADVVVGTAAVSDLRPTRTYDLKVKKYDLPDTLELAHNPDILRGLGERKEGRLLVGFAAETHDIVPSARKKMKDKNLDAIVANDVSDPAIGFGSATNRVTFITTSTEEQLDLMPKPMIAYELWNRLAPAAAHARDQRDARSRQ